MDDHDQNFDVAEIPDEFKALRSCLVCGLVKTMTQFLEHGCENCEKFLHLEGDTARIHECTTAYFAGLISMIDPQKSWVARWQRMYNGATPHATGMYAIDVVGELPHDVVEYLEDKGFEYKARKKI